MTQYPSKLFSHFEGNVDVELDLSNILKKSGVKKAVGVDASKLARKVDLAGLKLDVEEFDSEKLKSVPVNLNKSEVHRLDIGKLKTFLSFDLKNISNFLRNDVVKKIVY